MESVFDALAKAQENLGLSTPVGNPRLQRAIADVIAAVRFLAVTVQCDYRRKVKEDAKTKRGTEAAQ